MNIVDEDDNNVETMFNDGTDDTDDIHDTTGIVVLFIVLTVSLVESDVIGTEKGEAETDGFWEKSDGREYNGKIYC